jgi:hypothetical protein
MDSNAIKELLYGGVKELMNNREYYYHSSVSSDYSHWTTNGEKAIINYMSLIGCKILEIQAQELDKRAKELVIDGLKGKTND